MHRLDKTIGRCFKVCLLAPGATARSGEAFSLFKHIPAGHTAEREHHKLPFLCYCRKSDVGQMLVDFLFFNANGLGDFSGSHFLLVQKEEDFLADGLGMALVAHRQPSRSLSPRMCLVEFIPLLFSHTPSLSAISVISKT